VGSFGRTKAIPPIFPPLENSENRSELPPLAESATDCNGRSLSIRLKLGTRFELGREVAASLRHPDRKLASRPALSHGHGQIPVSSLSPVSELEELRGPSREWTLDAFSLNAFLPLVRLQ